MKLQVSRDAKRVLHRLEQAGYQAYLVGGCVRDMCMGRPSHDCDVATSARPEEVQAVFRRVYPTGLKHGTVTVLMGREQVEVTTFRSEEGYADARHPDTVHFENDIVTDLWRRDFTVNAMALGLDGRLIDPCGGREDIENRVMRSVGDPLVRFSEDALRMFRCVRFAATLGFSIEPSARAAMAPCAGGAEKIAAERIGQETEKVLLSPRPGWVSLLWEAGLLDRFQPDAPRDVSVLERLPAEPLYRWGALAVLMRQAAPAALLRDLRLPNAVTKPVAAAESFFRELESSTPALRRAIALHGEEVTLAACAMRDAIGFCGCTRRCMDLVAAGGYVTKQSLAIRGKHLRRRGINRGRATGELLRHLLLWAAEDPARNTRPQLMREARTWGTEHTPSE